MVRVGMKSILRPKNVKCRIEILGGYFDRLSAVFTQQMLMVAVYGHMPGAWLLGSQVDVVHETDSFEFFECAVNGRSVDLAESI